MVAADMPEPRRPLPPHLLRHSRMVAAMRLVLPALAAVLLGLLALWSKFGLDGNRLLLDVRSAGRTTIDSMTMSNPHFEGIDEKKRPFNVTAERATQLDKNGDVVDLHGPQADITLENGAWLALSADNGRYQRKEQLLNLGGGVSLFHDQGYELHTPVLRVDLATSRASSDQAVQGQGPAGNLTGEGLVISEGGKRMLLTGRSHMKLLTTDQLGTAVPKQ
ncbi:MAG: lipopolysaccharide export system protein LptC [Rhodospirillaceae bacterium]|jgi:lipopolysaccharide export system protein LptC|nr:lipopolysaccharide export system protein LptC [Rhodospirillaceae bacterium]